MEAGTNENSGVNTSMFTPLLVWAGYWASVRFWYIFINSDTHLLSVVFFTEKP